MQSLYTSDGSLPSQYSAWKPTSADQGDSASTAEAKAAPSASSDAGDSSDSGDSGDSFLQMSMSSLSTFELSKLLPAAFSSEDEQARIEQIIRSHAGDAEG